MTHPVKLSIITINWNDAKGLRQTVDSVVSQLTDECEFIIIDGLSTDDSVDIIKKHRSQIAYWISEPKGGIYTDMNKGIRQAKGEYCLFLNSGDWLKENSLQKALTECTGEDVIYFNTCLSYNNTRFEEVTYPHELTMQSFYKKTIGHQSTFIKRTLFLRYGLYNESNKIHSDYEFWIKAIIANNCSCKHVNQSISYYDMGGRSSKPTEETALEIKTIQLKYLPERILIDYERWRLKEKDLTVLDWYRRQKALFTLLVFIYKVVKNVKKIAKISRL